MHSLLLTSFFRWAQDQNQNQKQTLLLRFPCQFSKSLLNSFLPRVSLQSDFDRTAWRRRTAASAHGTASTNPNSQWSSCRAAPITWHSLIRLSGVQLLIFRLSLLPQEALRRQMEEKEERKRQEVERQRLEDEKEAERVRREQVSTLTCWRGGWALSVFLALCVSLSFSFSLSCISLFFSFPFSFPFSSFLYSCSSSSPFLPFSAPFLLSLLSDYSPLFFLSVSLTSFGDPLGCETLKGKFPCTYKANHIDTLCATCYRTSRESSLPWHIEAIYTFHLTLAPRNLPRACVGTSFVTAIFLPFFLPSFFPFFLFLSFLPSFLSLLPFFPSPFRHFSPCLGGAQASI